ncbi:uncharacterized protein LOC134844992 [Symsagittifera roscoffensis]|uniref:uncharacterized protein LOC134844992 n=1 Tax=Symsagittifera roscoffensis TaxID=84072 RepID=UPI00307B6631
MNRIRSATEQDISDSQSSSRQGRGKMDVAWRLKWLVAKSQNSQVELYLTGINTSAAIDTIDRKQLINTYHKVIPRDEFRLLTKLLTETNLEIKAEIYVRQDRDEAKPPAQLDHDCSTPKPDETIYADDTDFTTEEENDSTWIQENVTTILQTHRLKANPYKAARPISQ